MKVSPRRVYDHGFWLFGPSAGMVGAGVRNPRVWGQFAEEVGAGVARRGQGGLGYTGLQFR
ncbi:hypothetical protein E2562_038647 [Oryza meyeriana var. granulata]|uniref:Uncharacterized protein n=1 Tax=Oryza meyeriana var. granulata TaxID=110450 RepID=A0A6G1E9J6_9ORYZ|nr:hypothetical protein E2562_038647 [Oryza meyeriana var. granulata]